MKGTLVIISGPSGSGKDSFIDTLMDHDKSVSRALKITTRGPRDGERKVSFYEHVSHKAFCEIMSKSKIYYYVKNETWYGIDPEHLYRQLQSGWNVFLVCSAYDVVPQIKYDFLNRGFKVHLWLIRAKLEELEKRITKRGSLDKSQQAIRFSEMREELQTLSNYEHLFDRMVENNDGCLESIVSKAKKWLKA